MTHAAGSPVPLLFCAVLQPLVFSPCPELPTRVLIFRVFLRGLALLDAPVPLPVSALYLLP